MKTSAIKTLSSLKNKKIIHIFKKLNNPKSLVILSIIIVFMIIFAYLARPIFFDYKKNEQILKTKIENYLKINSNINGKISYYIFPTPRINVRGLEIKFNKNDTKSLKFKSADFLIGLKKLNSIKEIEIKKFIAKNQKIEIFPSEFKNYLEYFQKYNVDNLIIKNSEIFFKDAQNNKISSKIFNLKNTFNGKKEKILINGIFAKNKFKIKFVNEMNKEKFLNFAIPDLNTNVKVIFDKDSNLEKTSGKLNLKIDNNILLINFDGNKVYKISDSFFRNKFLNSKLNGTINFENNFFFDLDFKVNQANIKKLFSYYGYILNTSPSGQFELSKKINGKTKVSLKRTDSFLGRVENIKFTIFFENGDLKIKSGSANLGNNSKINFNLSLLGKGKDQRIIFFINFLSNDGEKFLKKFNINSKSNEISINTSGKISTTYRKVKFDKLTLNNEKINREKVNDIEAMFNKHVLQENVFGFFDFFKIKKFIFETYSNLD